MTGPQPAERTSAARRIWQWQQDFDAQPRIWFTLDSDGNPMNFYDSREAAMVEMEWCKSRRGAFSRVSVGSSPIHNLDLSKRRWRLPTPPAGEVER